MPSQQYALFLIFISDNWNQEFSVLSFFFYLTTNSVVISACFMMTSSNGNIFRVTGHLWGGGTWWRHQMETFSALLAICAGNSPVPVNSPHKGQWRRVLMFSLICTWINVWKNNRETGDFRRHSTHYDVIVMNSPVPGEFPTQRPVTRSFDVFFDLHLNKEMSKQSWGWWFETLSRPLWCHCNV